ncbi:uncharacterized protein LOC144995442 [Oryzias latipes]
MDTKTPAAAVAARTPQHPQGSRQKTTPPRAFTSATQARANRTAAGPPEPESREALRDRECCPSPNRRAAPPPRQAGPTTSPTREVCPQPQTSTPSPPRSSGQSPAPTPGTNQDPPRETRCLLKAAAPAQEGGTQEKRGPTRVVVNMARPGSPTVGNLARADAQGQGPEPPPQGHGHPRLKCDVKLRLLALQETSGIPLSAWREDCQAQETSTQGPPANPPPAQAKKPPPQTKPDHHSTSPTAPPHTRARKTAQRPSPPHPGTGLDPSTSWCRGGQTTARGLDPARLHVVSGPLNNIRETHVYFIFFIWPHDQDVTFSSPLLQSVLHPETL